MIVLGLTGAIAMGKSTVAKQFAYFKVQVFDADKINHEILANDKTVLEKIKQVFPQIVFNDVIDRKKLGDIVFNDKKSLEKLENILHPEIMKKVDEFIQKHSNKKIILLDIPLLFETGLDKKCDYTISVEAPYFLQKIRVLTRPTMTEDKFKKIISHQERYKTDFIIDTGLGLSYSFKQVKDVLKRLCSIIVLI